MSLAFQDQPARNRDELVVRGDLAAEVTAQLAPEIRRLETALRALVPKDYPTPQVTVNPPQVTLKAEAPPAKVDVEVEVELEGFDGLAAEIKALRGDLSSVVAVLSRPTVRTVKRDSDGRITEITDRRA